MNKGKIAAIVVALVLVGGIVAFVMSEPDSKRQEVTQELKDHQEFCKKNAFSKQCQQPEA